MQSLYAGLDTARSAAGSAASAVASTAASQYNKLPSAGSVLTYAKSLAGNPMAQYTAAGVVAASILAGGSAWAYSAYSKASEAESDEAGSGARSYLTPISDLFSKAYNASASHLSNVRKYFPKSGQQTQSADTQVPADPSPKSGEDLSQLPPLNLVSGPEHDVAQGNMAPNNFVLCKAA